VASRRLGRAGEALRREAAKDEASGPTLHSDVDEPFLQAPERPDDFALVIGIGDDCGPDSQAMRWAHRRRRRAAQLRVDEASFSRCDDQGEVVGPFPGA